MIYRYGTAQLYFVEIYNIISSRTKRNASHGETHFYIDSQISKAHNLQQTGMLRVNAKHPDLLKFFGAFVYKQRI